MRIPDALPRGALMLLLFAMACSPSGSPTPIPTIVLSQNPSGTETGVTASGVIVPVRKVDLGFPMTGVVSSVAVQVGDSVKQGQQLISLDTSILQAQTALADANLQASQISYTYLARTGTDQEHLDSALAEVARQHALLDSAKATLAQATLSAPFDGTIAALDTAPAETVTPGESLLTLGDLSEFQVETTDLSERDAPMVAPGQTAQIDVIALNQSFGGTVTDISRISSTIGGDVVYKVTLKFDSQPPGLLWGMSTTVHISTAK
jgi:RND family efflux transporter MFP subunit